MVRRAPQSDPGATERVLRRRVRRPYHRAGFGSASTGAIHLQGAPVAVAHRAELRGKLPVHCHCVDQSPLPHALCHGGDPSPVVVQFRAFVFMSLLPLSTAWMAVSELSPQPVAFYAAVFFLVNATYTCLITELIIPNPVEDIPPRVRRVMRFRAVTTLCFFAAAAVVALKYPLTGLGI